MMNATVLHDVRIKAPIAMDRDTLNNSTPPYLLGTVHTRCLAIIAMRIPISDSTTPRNGIAVPGKIESAARQNAIVANLRFRFPALFR
jgi:hypothetical protein